MGPEDSVLELARGAPSPSRWTAVLESLDQLDDAAVEAVLPSLEEALAHWPPMIRTLPWPWVQGLREGNLHTPRLALIRHLVMAQVDLDPCAFAALPWSISGVTAVSAGDGERLVRALDSRATQPLEHLSVRGAALEVALERLIARGVLGRVASLVAWDLTDRHALALARHLGARVGRLELGGSSALTPAGAAALAGAALPGVRALLAGDSRPLIALVSAGWFERLESIRLHRIGLGVPQIDRLEVPALAELELVGDEIGDAGMARIAAMSLPRLRRLKVAVAGVGDAGAAALAKSALLGELERLDLSSNPITDAGVRALAAAPAPRLVELWLPRRPGELAPEVVDAIAGAAHLSESVRGDYQIEVLARQMWPRARGPDLARADAILRLSAAEFAAARARQPRTAGEAWALLLEAAEVGPRRWLGAARAPLYDVEDPAHIVRDAALAGFVREHPGELEALVLARFAELPLDAFFHEAPDTAAALACGGRRSVNPLALTLCAWDPAAGLALVDRAWQAWDRDCEAPLFGDTLSDNVINDLLAGAAFFVRRGDPELLDTLAYMAPESRDVVRWLATCSVGAFTELFDGVAHRLAPAEIEAALVRYTGWDARQLHARMTAGTLSGAGFLAEGQRLGDVVAADLATLAARGVSLRSLAERLEALVVEGRRRRYEGRAAPLPFALSYVGYLGHQQHPFHRFDLWQITQRGGGDLSIEWDDGTRLHVPDLAPDLIARFGFFQGGPMRIDPLVATRAAGLATTA